MEANPDVPSPSSLNMKEISTAIAMQMLKSARHEAVVVHAKRMIEFARKWGATIPPDQESQAINELKEFFPEPATWPSLKVTTESGTLSSSTSAAPRGRPKQDSDPDPKDNSKRKASDYAELKVPDGVSPPLCPAAIKSGDRDGQACGKVCKRVLDGHNPEIPECAQFKCNHMFCGTHITKAAGMNSTAARKRLEKTPDPSSSPVTVTEEGKTTSLNTVAVEELKPEVSSGAGKSTLSKILAKVNARNKGAGQSSDVSNNNNE